MMKNETPIKVLEFKYYLWQRAKYHAPVFAFKCFYDDNSLICRFTLPITLNGKKGDDIRYQNIISFTEIISFRMPEFMANSLVDEAKKALFDFQETQAKLGDNND